MDYVSGGTRVEHAGDRKKKFTVEIAVHTLTCVLNNNRALRVPVDQEVEQSLCFFNSSTLNYFSPLTFFSPCLLLLAAGE